MTFPVEVDPDELIPRFTLRRVSAIEWVIEERPAGPHSHGRDVARIFEIDEFEVDVVWTAEIERLAHYMSPQEVLDDLHRAVSGPRRPRSSRPVPIPHLRPRPA